MNDEINITIPALTRVEGEGALSLRVKNNRIEQLQLSIYEPPRLFEQGIVGRHYQDVPDMVARICGICPVAYQMSAVQALESVFQVQVSGWVERMRRLYYCGEWIESHALHMHLLALPDFLGFNSVVEMAEKYPAEVNRGLTLQHLGNEIIALLGGRSVNPVGACVGGFHAVPRDDQTKRLIDKLDPAIEQAMDMLEWISSIDYPETDQSFVYASLRNGRTYPMLHGDIQVSDGTVIKIEEFAEYFKEKQVEYSTALHCLYRGRDYLVGPLARLNNNHELLPDLVLSLIERIQLKLPSTNVFDSIIARAIEIVFCLIEAKTILLEYKQEDSQVNVTPRAGIGFGCTEAPRGLLWHRYETDVNGDIKKCRIVPPTSQNQARIEQDIRFHLEQTAFEPDQQSLKLLAEQVIRNYDPCISCATHFLDFSMVRV